MIIFDYINQVNEKASNANIGGSKGKEKTRSNKSKVPIYNSINAALGSSLEDGALFSTTGSKRIYIITAKPWGNLTQSKHGRTAKGFSSGKDQSPKNAGWKAIKGASERAKERAGTETVDKGSEYHHSRKEAGESQSSEDK